MALIPIPSDCLSLPAARRLVVILPNYRQIDAYQLGKQVRKLASGYKIPVLYLTIVNDYDSELPALHALTHLAAITNDARVRADVMVEYGLSWPSAVQRICSPEDAVLCMDEYRIRTGIFHQEQLSTLLGKKLNLPVYLYLNGSGPHSAAGHKNGR